MKKLFLCLFLISSNAVSQVDPPEDMYHFDAPFTLACTPSFMSMVDHLANDFGEIPMVMSHMSQDTTIVLFVNKESTTSTVVVTRRIKTEEEACIIWAGQSNGTSFSVNPDPVFPEKSL
jgi:hypothetical protein